MSVTILQLLKNAEHNLTSIIAPQRASGHRQLQNAIALLEKGYGIHDDFNEVVGYGDVDDVPVCAVEQGTTASAIEIGQLEHWKT